MLGDQQEGRERPGDVAHGALCGGTERHQRALRVAGRRDLAEFDRPAVAPRHRPRRAIAAASAKVTQPRGRQRQVIEASASFVIGPGDALP